MFKNLINQIKNISKSPWFRFLIGAAILALGGTGFVLVRQKTKKSPYKTASVERKDLSQTISASGKIKSDEEATLKFQTSGELSWIGIKKGDRVKKWQAIASLDKRELEKDLKKELLDYMNERWDFDETMEVTYRDQALTEVIRIAKEKAQFDLDKTVLDVEIADIALKYATLVSPIDGIVTGIEAPHAGTNITPTTAEFTISNPDRLIFSANVDEVDIGQVKEEQKTTLLLDAYPDEEIETRVKQIEFTSTTTSGGGTAFAVHFDLPPNTEQEKFKLGMNGDVEIFIREQKDVLVVPFEVIQEDEDGVFVWLLKEGKPVRQEVKTGISNDIYTQITDGLQQGDEVIISGLKQQAF